ncbi:MAG: VWA domain-containing protein [Candidatus Polarisedimenticolia bacterium]|nr:VWA domain-containing protein [bacterium]
MRPKTVSGRRAAVALVALLLLSAALPARAQEDPLPTDITETVRVELVQFNVLATDKAGEPVTDLKPEDLRVFDDGEEQRVAFVEPYAAPLPAQVTVRKGGRAAQEAAAAPAAPAAAGEAALPERERGRYIVLFFDTYNTSLRTRNLAIKAALEFVEQKLRPRDRVAVANFTGKLKMVQTFTSDHGQLTAAINAVAGDMKNSLEDRVGALDDLVDAMGRCKNTSYAWTCVTKQASQWEYENRRTQDIYLSALTTLVRAIAPIPAVKVLVLFSDGIPRDATAEANDAAAMAMGEQTASQMINHAPLASGDRSWTRFAEAAASARVSVFSICPGANFGRFGAISARQGQALSEVNNKSQIDIYRNSEANLIQGVAELAARTGGKLLRSADIGVSLGETVKAASGLYTVGFYPRGQDVGIRTHKIRVKPQRRGLDVTAARDVPRRVIQMALTGELTTEKSGCEGDRRQLLVRLRLDRSRLAFEEIKGALSANFSVYTELLVDGVEEPAFVDYRFFNASRDAKMGGDAFVDPTVEQRLIVPCGDLRVALTATDSATGARAVFTARIEK